MWSGGVRRPSLGSWESGLNSGGVGGEEEASVLG